MGNSEINHSHRRVLWPYLSIEWYGTSIAYQSVQNLRLATGDSLLEICIYIYFTNVFLSKRAKFEVLHKLYPYSRRRPRRGCKASDNSLNNKAPRGSEHKLHAFILQKKTQDKLQKGRTYK